MRAASIVALILSSNLVVSTIAARETEHGAPRDPARLEADYQSLLRTLDRAAVSRDYPGAVRQLDADHPDEVLRGIRTLGATRDPAAIAFLAPLVEAKRAPLRIAATAAISDIVAAHELRRRDATETDAVVLRPRRPGELDLRPLRGLVLRMLAQPDDGNTRAHAATIIGYLQLRDFQAELRSLQNSRHPAVVQAASSALRLLDVDSAAFTSAEIAAAAATGKKFAQLFRDRNDDELGLILPPRNELKRIVAEASLAETTPARLYGKMSEANTRRFREFRATFNDLSKLNRISFEPGRLATSEFYADGVRLMKNSFVTISYANRISIRIKLEEMVILDGRCYLVELD